MASCFVDSWSLDWMKPARTGVGWTATLHTQLTRPQIDVASVATWDKALSIGKKEN